ncbi:MAG: FAD-dependent thymidylate synthase [Actinomycetota bacterium]|nr:FAD-dependent thymidylate synthase [Actinomycetota bacterium]
MNVNLLEFTPNPERTVAAAARLCYAPIGADELLKNLGDHEVEKMVTLIIGSGHLSAVEHAVFTFAVGGISRACSHQLVRHRIASYNQQSQRYVKYAESPDFIVPPAVGENFELKEIFTRICEATHRVYRDLLEAGVEAEDARYVLPNAAETKIVITMNARELLHFFELRCCERAQWEIRGLAMGMLDKVKSVAPLLFAKAGPACNRGPCKEGKFSCGRPWKKI